MKLLKHNRLQSLQSLFYLDLARLIRVGMLLLIVLTAGIHPALTQDVPVPDYIPENGGWWRIADRNPDISPYEYTIAEPAVVDFTIYQARDSTWQLVACIKNTNVGGGSRFLYRWEAQNLTDSDWTPQGIFWLADASLGQTEGRIQAPHCFVYNGKYYMFYNSNSAYCLVSDDGKVFEHHRTSENELSFFAMGRDVQLLNIDGLWHAYFLQNVSSSDADMHARTSPTIEGPWTTSSVNVHSDGNPESPFVIRRGDDYYLWEQSNVFHSTDPLNFNVPRLTVNWQWGWAPEVIVHEGRYYVAHYSGQVIRMAELTWSGNASRPFIITNASASLPNGYQDNPYHTRLFADGGDGEYTFSIASGTLPQGLSLNASTGVITGLPSTVGNHHLTIRIEDGQAESTSIVMNIAILPHPSAEIVAAESIRILGEDMITLQTAAIEQLEAEILPANATNRSVTWQSDNTNVVTVDGNGRVMGVSEGSAVVTVRTVDGGYTASVTVNVINVSVSGVVIEEGEHINIDIAGSLQLTATVQPANATNKSVTWHSDNTSVVTVDGNGMVTGVSEGSAVVTVRTDDGGHTASVTVDVIDSDISVSGVVIEEGEHITIDVAGSLQLTAAVQPGNATNKSVTWHSDNTSVVTVDGNGTVTGVSEGSAVVTVRTVDGNHSASISVTVNQESQPEGIQISEGDFLVIEQDASRQLTAVAFPSDADIQWNTTDAEIVTVTDSGYITGIAPGTAFVSAAMHDSRYVATIQITVISSGYDIPKFFSPDNNGENDYWTWRNLDKYNNCQLVVFSRNGKEVYEARPYGNNWNGSRNGQSLQAADYYYIVTCDDGRVIKGAFRILR